MKRPIRCCKRCAMRHCILRCKHVFGGKACVAYQWDTIRRNTVGVCLNCSKFKPKGGKR